MSTKQDIANSMDHGVKLSSYVLGYVFSICLTLEAYVVVTGYKYTYDTSVSLIIGLALVQFVVQLMYFLHLGNDYRSKWKLFVLTFMICIVAIIVFGSLWIMSNLNYRMTPSQVDQYMQNQGGF